jgi:hypothetical protein
MAEPKNPINIPTRENLGASAPPVEETTPGDANPDLERPATPGPVPNQSDPEGAKKRGDRPGAD